MAVRVILPTFGKSRKTTKSDPSTGDQLGKRERGVTLPSRARHFCLNLFQLGKREYLFKPVSTKFRAVPCRPVGKRRE